MTKSEKSHQLQHCLQEISIFTFIPDAVLIHWRSIRYKVTSWLFFFFIQLGKGSNMIETALQWSSIFRSFAMGAYWISETVFELLSAYSGVQSSKAKKIVLHRLKHISTLLANVLYYLIWKITFHKLISSQYNITAILRINYSMFTYFLIPYSLMNFSSM